MNSFIVILLAFFGSTCPEHFWRGVEPTLSTSVVQTNRDKSLCFKGFALYHSGSHLTPVWVAEHLTAASVEQAHALTRENDFHEEERLPPKYRAWLSDYHRSGYDRGHQAPSADMPTPEAQRESFSLANMIPQNGELNRGLWERIERSVRLLARDNGEVYVLTGPLYRTGQPLQAGRIHVPTHLWKLVFLPSQNAAAAYLCTNTNTDTYDEISITQLEQLSGINFGIKGVQVLQLPRPKRRKSKDWF